jgi:hypothetical protein
MDRAGDESMAGCTANVVLITENEIYCANAGDSRSIIRLENVTIFIFFNNNISIYIINFKNRKQLLYLKIINQMIQKNKKEFRMLVVMWLMDE